jgi:GNAT superfamily N-acetyltransferase
MEPPCPCKLAAVTSIRIATASDVPALVRLRIAMDAEEGVTARDTFATDFHAWSEVYLDRFTVFVADVTDVIVGTLWLERVERVPRPSHGDGPMGYVTNFYVEPGQRDRGVGGELLRSLVDYAKTRGYELLIASPSDRSEPLWRRAGFGPTDFLEIDLK